MWEKVQAGGEGWRGKEGRSGNKGEYGMRLGNRDHGRGEEAAVKE